jgi:protein-L-isoaspartate(D-aspartate) O-methyltransferase
LPSLGITFYAEHRRELGQFWLGPWRGTQDWQQHRQQIRVPLQSREGILRIGLFGATGEASFDAVRIDPVGTRD